MYLRLKSFQRFTETWALLERCAAAGLFGTHIALQKVPAIKLLAWHCRKFRQLNYR
jgi:hypothetical protein